MSFNEDIYLEENAKKIIEENPAISETQLLGLIEALKLRRASIITDISKTLSISITTTKKFLDDFDAVSGNNIFKGFELLAQFLDNFKLIQLDQNIRTFISAKLQEFINNNPENPEIPIIQNIINILKDNVNTRLDKIETRLTTLESKTTTV